MRYRAGCDCTDFDGVFYSRDQEAELDGAVVHSAHLKPMEAPVIGSEQLEPAPVAEPEAKAPAKRKTKGAKA